MKKLLLVFAIVVCWHEAFADVQQASSPEASSGNPRFDEFYTVSEEKNLIDENSISRRLNPVDAAQDFFTNGPEWVSELKAQLLSLLQFVHHSENYGDVNEPYNRAKHFGGWINDKSDDTCFNTRAKVLVRDSKTQVTLNSRGCTVVSGTWDEPYAGKEVTKASEIQIDHFVPLKNAYISGAYKWDFPKRCLYANYMGNDFHLISADGSQNMRKGDKSPEGYMPPNQAYSCQYLQQWLKVKLIWDLGLTPPEKAAVLSLIQQNHCDMKQFTYSVQDLQKQRNFMADHADLCN